MIELALDTCKDCPLKDVGGIKHSYRGPIPARVMLIGEAPGAAEQQIGEVFRGRAGKLLSAILTETGFKEDDEVFICNTLLCRPPGKDKPQAAELKCCRPNIETILKAVAPEVIVPIGNTALKWLTGKSGVMAWHGTKMTSPYGTVIPAIHPAHALRSGARISPKSDEEKQSGIRGYIVSDFTFIRKVLDGSEEAKKPLDYKLISTVEDLEGFVDDIQKADRIAVDIETTGLTFFRDKIIGISFSWREGQAVYIPLLVRPQDAPDGVKPLKATDTVREIPEVIERWAQFTDKKPKIPKPAGLDLVPFWGSDHLTVVSVLREVVSLDKRFTGWNFKFDTKAIAAQWGVIPKISDDGLFQSFLLDENTPNDLKSNTDMFIRELRGYAHELYDTLSQSEVEEEKYAAVPLDTLFKYGCGDADATLRLTILQEQKLRERHPEYYDNYYHPFYIALHHIYAEAEIEGGLVDPAWVNQVGLEIIDRLYTLEQEAYGLAGQEFNPGSSQQLIKILYGPDSVFQQEPFEDEKLQTAKGGPSTKELVLKELFYRNSKTSKVSKFIRVMLEYRKLMKQMSTYIIGCTIDLDEFGRAHWRTNLIGATTGRLSVKRIPIQTLPRDSKMRGMFIANPGWKLIEADYSQLELRLASWYSQDPTMVKEFTNKEDMHKNTAADVFKVPLDQVTKQQRKTAKGINFGNLYGGGPRTLADSINDKLELDETPVSLQEAEKFQTAWSNRYRGYLKWQAKVHQSTMKHEQVVSPTDRIRRLPAATSQEKKDQQEALRQGPNSLIQGLGSDLAEFALVRIVVRFQNEKLHGRFRWSVHDALFFEVPDCEVIRSCAIIKEELERPDPRCSGLSTPTELKVFKERWAGPAWEEHELAEAFKDVSSEVKPFDSWLTKIKPSA